MSSLRMDFEKEGISFRINWDLTIEIFEFLICNLQGGFGGRVGGWSSWQKVRNFIFLLSESFLPLRLLIWAWNFHLICFEKFLVVGGWWCTYDFNISLSPNLWIMTFDLDLDLDLGLTTKKLSIFWNYLALVHIKYVVQKQRDPYETVSGTVILTNSL